MGGQIINPSSNIVSLYQGNWLIDSIELNENNRFFKTYDSLCYGVFKLEHLPGEQNLILEKGDSLWFRINTTDFNSSLVFSGRGSAKNNFLIDIYLALQKENSFLASQYSKNSFEFRHIIDSLYNEKRKIWMRFDSLNKLTYRAKVITQASYIYPYANRKERYAIIRGRKNIIAQDSSYFDFREKLNFAEEDLAYFEPYMTYILNFLNLEALHEDESFFEAKNETNFNFRRLEVIDEMIKTPQLKNNLARSVAYEELINFKNFKNHNHFLQHYTAINTSKEYSDEILSLQLALRKMQAQQPLPVLQLENSEAKHISSNQALTGTPTVLYFWSQTQMNHYKKTQERVKMFENKFPNYRYVGICIQSYNKLVHDYQKVMEINPKDQYAFVDFEEASEKWVLTLLNKGILIDGEGKIIEGFGNFYSYSFEEALKKNSP